MDIVIPNGVLAPDFRLPDIYGVEHDLIQYRGRIVVLNFWSAECPWSERGDRTLAEAKKDWEEELVVILTVDSNANETPDLIRRAAAERSISPVFIDQDHRVADLYGAVTTPQVFLIDPAGHLRYQGAIDDATFRKQDGTHFYLVDAVESLIHGRSPEPDFAPPYGCAIVRE